RWLGPLPTRSDKHHLGRPAAEKSHRAPWRLRLFRWSDPQTHTHSCGGLQDGACAAPEGVIHRTAPRFQPRYDHPRHRNTEFGVESFRLVITEEIVLGAEEVVARSGDRREPALCGFG